MSNCKFCNRTCKSDNNLRNHERLCKNNPNKQVTWLTNNQDKIIEIRKSQGNTNQFTKAKRLGLPIPIVSEETRRKYSEAGLKRKHTSETKEKLSKIMKKRHKEGTAWNIGKSRWNNEPSYPEKFFMKVIENEFDDKNYIKEYPIENYSIDFAWPKKKLAIEIDGEQHQRFDDVKERDKRKDQILTENGWKILRIEWKKMFKDTKTYINIAKQFIHS